MPRKRPLGQTKAYARRLRLELLKGRVADQRYARRAARAMERARWQDSEYRRLLLEKLNLEFAAEIETLEREVEDMHHAQAGLPTQDELEFRYGTGEWAGLQGAEQGHQ